MVQKRTELFGWGDIQSIARDVIQKHGTDRKK